MLRKIRSAILFIYVVIVITLFGGGYIWLRSSWNDQRELVGQRLVADASLVTNFIQASLIDVSKLLDLARNRIVELSERRRLSPEAVHNVLDGTLRSISFSVSNDLRGLLFFIDPHARMVAQSGLFPAPAYDFSERLYYRALMTQPSAKFAIGNMLVAKTTGQLVFHISMPVRSEKGELLGVLVQQIRVHDVATVVKDVLENRGAIITTRLPGGETVFAFPIEATPPAVGSGACATGANKGSFIANENDQRLLVGYAFSPVFSLCSSATLPEDLAFAHFIRAHLPELIGAAIVFLLTSGLFVALLSLVRRLAQEIELSNHDPLTGLRNRRFLDAVYESYCLDAIRNNAPLSVLFLDLDHFKLVNDTFGHATGDAVLKSLCGVIRDRVKRPLDVCCRWGGEEFVVLLPNTDLDGALLVAREIQERLRDLVINSGAKRVPSLTLSIGIVSRFLHAGSVLDDLVALADKAMLKAKAEGRNRIVVHEEETTRETVDAGYVTSVANAVTTAPKTVESKSMSVSGRN